MAKSRKRKSSKKVKGSEPWRNVYVLGRIDTRRGYERGNMHWRLARTPKEARMGIEEWYPGEPEHIPLTPEQKAERALLKSEDERRTYDVWAHMVWRGTHNPETN